MAALDPPIIDPLREIENVVPFEAQVVERVHPLAAGIEVSDFAHVPSLADLHVPRTETGTLKTGAEDYIVAIEASSFVRDHCAAPVEFGDRAPGSAVTDALFLLRYTVNARLQCVFPARTGVN